MAALPSGSSSLGGLIFVTGATGFIGSQVVKTALQAGFRVRLSVRRGEQIEKLQRLFKDNKDSIEFVVIPNLTATNAFDHALSSVRYVLHLASPMPGKGTDYREDYGGPAIKGTEVLLAAASKISSIERVVIMSSVLALLPLGSLTDTSGTYNEESKLDLPIDLDMKFPDGPMVSGAMYQASKIMAHTATLNFIEKNKPHYGLVTIHPSFVLGHSLIQETAESIDGINAFLWQTLQAEKPFFPPMWVHVKDVAEGTLKALDPKIGNGEAFLLSGNQFTWEDVVAYLKEKYPSLPVNLKGPFDGSPVGDSTKATKVLGIQWRSYKEMISDVIDQQLALRAAYLLPSSPYNFNLIVRVYTLPLAAMLVKTRARKRTKLQAEANEYAAARQRQAMKTPASLPTLPLELKWMIFQHLVPVQEILPTDNLEEQSKKESARCALKIEVAQHGKPKISFPPGHIAHVNYQLRGEMLDFRGRALHITNFSTDASALRYMDRWIARHLHCKHLPLTTLRVAIKRTATRSQREKLDRPPPRLECYVEIGPHHRTRVLSRGVLEPLYAPQVISRIQPTATYTGEIASRLARRLGAKFSQDIKELLQLRRSRNLFLSQETIFGILDILVERVDAMVDERTHPEYFRIWTVDG
ncbi:NAD dependent epimerase/dehydratase-like protein 6 [Elsinoe fawcettii]|nr:NAD dependent epimerase/dehydratase-like protein 6 [Elsinoe fawcettii]